MRFLSSPLLFIVPDTASERLGYDRCGRGSMAHRLETVRKTQPRSACLADPKIDVRAIRELSRVGARSDRHMRCHGPPMWRWDERLSAINSQFLLTILSEQRAVSWAKFSCQPGSRSQRLSNLRRPLSNSFGLLRATMVTPR